MKTLKFLADQELQELVAAETALTIIDVRSHQEYLDSHILGSINLPLETCLAYKGRDFLEKDCLFHCRSGMRTKQAAAALAAFPCKQAYCLDGGISQWQQNGYGVEQQEKSMPLDVMRQVQLLIGFLVMVFVLLAAFISTSWLIGAFILGAGIFTAGLTGTCLLANVLLKLPFNKLK